MGNNRTLIFVVLAAAMALVWFALDPRSFPAEPDRALQSLTADPAESVERPDPSKREIATLEVPPPAVAEDPSVADAKSAAKAEFAAADALYREKYRAFSKEQLVLASHDLERRVKSEMERITEAIHASGDLDTLVVQAGEASPRLLGTNPGSPVAAVAFSEEAPRADGARVLHRRQIDATNYPDFHALQVESCWVASEVRHRGY